MINKKQTEMQLNALQLICDDKDKTIQILYKEKETWRQREKELVRINQKLSEQNEKVL